MPDEVTGKFSGDVLTNPRTWLFVIMIATLVAMLMMLKEPWVGPFVVGAGVSSFVMFVGAWMDSFMCLYN